MPSKQSKLNPQITSFEIGTRDLRKIKIYPLAAGPQLKLIDTLGQSAELLSEVMDDAQSVGSIIGIITTNLPEILEQVTDKNEKVEDILNEISIVQIEELVEVIYKMNFESLGKKLTGLFTKAMQVAEVTEKLPLKGPSQQSANIMDTD